MSNATYPTEYNNHMEQNIINSDAGNVHSS